MTRSVAAATLVLTLGGAGFMVGRPGGDADAVRDVTAAPAAEQPSIAATCQVERTLALSRDVRESSGLALSGDGAAVWTHNDAGSEPVLYRVDLTDGSLEPVRIEGARSVDWEDIATAPCEGGHCLYIGDIGDNDAERDMITIYRVVEPPAGTSSARAEAMPARYPDGPRDAEALFVVDGTPHIVTKGREGPIELFRYPSTWRAGEYPELERVRRVMARPAGESGQVTGAGASADGNWVALRTYERLELHATPTMLSGAAPPALSFDLLPLGEAQGEGVAVQDDGTVWLSSEAESGGAPTLTRLRCALPGR